MGIVQTHHVPMVIIILVVVVFMTVIVCFVILYRKCCYSNKQLVSSDMHNSLNNLSTMHFTAATSQQAGPQKCFPATDDCTGFSFYMDSACHCTVYGGRSYMNLYGNCANPSCSDGNKYIGGCGMHDWQGCVIVHFVILQKVFVVNSYFLLTCIIVEIWSWCLVNS